MTTGNKNIQVMVRLTEADKAALDELSIKMDVPISQIVREAVREKVGELKAGLAEPTNLLTGSKRSSKGRYRSDVDQ